MDSRNSAGIERKIEHGLFLLSVWSKGIGGLVEAIGGLLLLYWQRNCQRFKWVTATLHPCNPAASTFSRLLVPWIVGRVDIGDAPRAFSVYLDDRLFSGKAKHRAASRKNCHAADWHVLESFFVELLALAHRKSA